MLNVSVVHLVGPVAMYSINSCWVQSGARSSVQADQTSVRVRTQRN